MFPIPLSAKNLQQAIQTHAVLDDPKVVPHLAHIFDLIKSENIQNLDLAELSNIIKQTRITHSDERKAQQNHQKHWFEGKRENIVRKHNFLVANFVKQAEKLEIAGISLGESVNELIQLQLIRVAEEKGLNECRFWGKILGSFADYYIIQGYRPAPKQHLNITLGSQKPGEGVNFYTYFVTNSLQFGYWQELPHVSIEQLRAARNIKKVFTGNLNNPISSYPAFPGVEKHYLKAQISRITHSLELSPKGIYKVNDDNPKVIEFQQQVKVPDFSQLSTLEGWVHRNPMILNLGRCTHFVDPSLPQEQLEAAASELAEKDPEIERLRGITQDKPVEQVEGGPESFWIQRIVGNNQTFPKEQAQNVYAVTTLKNVLWPGWVAVGYMGGYSNFYLGNGLKASQPAWSTLANENLQEEGIQVKEFPQPNPKELPKVQAEVNQQEVNQQEGDD